jgi:hypothetical protein
MRCSRALTHIKHRRGARCLVMARMEMRSGPVIRLLIELDGKTATIGRTTRLTLVRGCGCGGGLRKYPLVSSSNTSYLTVPMTFSARYSAFAHLGFTSRSRDVDIAAASARDQAFASTISGGSALRGGAALRGTSRSPTIIAEQHDCAHGIGGAIDRGRELAPGEHVATREQPRV